MFNSFITKGSGSLVKIQVVQSYAVHAVATVCIDTEPSNLSLFETHCDTRHVPGFEDLIKKAYLSF